MNCSHTKPDQWQWADVEVSPWGETEAKLVNTGGQWTYEDLDIGRFRCTQCREVFYYTGLWRDFYERGVPCPGSDRLIRA